MAVLKKKKRKTKNEEHDIRKANKKTPNTCLELRFFLLHSNTHYILYELLACTRSITLYTYNILVLYYSPRSQIYWHFFKNCPVTTPTNSSYGGYRSHRCCCSSRVQHTYHVCMTMCATIDFFSSPFSKRPIFRTAIIKYLLVLQQLYAHRHTDTHTLALLYVPMTHHLVCRHWHCILLLCVSVLCTNR